MPGGATPGGAGPGPEGLLSAFPEHSQSIPECCRGRELPARPEIPGSVDDLVDCGLLVPRARDDVLVIRGDVTAQHGRGFLGLGKAGARGGKIHQVGFPGSPSSIHAGGITTSCTLIPTRPSQGTSPLSRITWNGNLGEAPIPCPSRGLLPGRCSLRRASSRR